MIQYDNLIEKYFLRQPDGRSIYRPWGTLGSSYWVDSTDREQRMRSPLRRRLKVSRVLLPLLIVPWFLIGNISSSYRPFFWTLLLFAWGAFFLWWELTNRDLTRGLERAPRIKATASGEKLPRWLDSIAAGRSLTAHLFHVILLGAVAVYAAKDLGRTWPPTISGVFAILILWPLVLILVAALITKIRKKATLGGPSPEQQFTRGIFRSLWIFAAALFLLALVQLFLQARHQRDPAGGVNSESR